MAVKKKAPVVKNKAKVDAAAAEAARKKKRQQMNPGQKKRVRNPKP